MKPLQPNVAGQYAAWSSRRAGHQLTDLLGPTCSPLDVRRRSRAPKRLEARADGYLGRVPGVATGLVLSESSEGGGEDDEGKRGNRSEEAKHVQYL